MGVGSSLAYTAILCALVVACVMLKSILRIVESFAYGSWQ